MATSQMKMSDLKEVLSRLNRLPAPSSDQPSTVNTNLKVTSSGRVQVRNPKKKKERKPSIYNQYKIQAISQLKYRATDTSSASLVMLTNAGSRIHVQELTAITQGDLADNRESNKIRLANVFGLFLLRNYQTTPRYFRVTIVGFRGSQTSLDTTTWTNLYMDPSTRAAYALTGVDLDRIGKVNTNVCKKYYDKIFKIDGTTSGANEPTRTITINKRLGNLATYDLGGSVVTKGKTWIIISVCETVGVAPSATQVTCMNRIRTSFFDTK